MTAMSVHVEWTAHQRADMQYELEFGKWSSKNLIGSADKDRMRSPCIRVVNHRKRHRKLRHYQIVWVMEKGPIKVPGVEVNHLCASIASGGIAQCINIDHMKLGSKRMNGSNTEDQKELVKYWRSNRMKTKFKGPLFLKDIGSRPSAPRITRSSPFLNCQLIRTVSSGWPLTL